ncbi:MAG TPA: NOP5/NOP56 family protein [Candidatus Nanoarchaeia archaeon]|nr:NOP5/NOP56 family protein [Candidatus Nanoarchaeia archaeon]
MSYQFQNILGTFILDEQIKSVQLAKKSSPEIKLVPKEKITQALALFKDKKYFPDFYQKNLELTKLAIKKSVSEDNFIIQAIANINELDKASNLLTKRLREWYGLYFPELEQKISSPEKLVELILTKERKELLKELKIKETMGADLEKVHLQEILELAKKIKELQDLRKKHEIYLETVMQKYSPNLLELAGATLGAKLLELGKSLKHLALLPASTIQLLGAEKALFRHIKTGSRSPKYGILFQHPLVQNAKKEDKGKAARMLADKLSLCARLDYFKGEFKAKEYRKELEKKFS